MSVDAQKFMDLMTYLNLLWSAPFQIIVAMTLLYQQLGFSSFAGLAYMICTMPINLVIGNQMKKYQVSFDSILVYAFQLENLSVHTFHCFIH